METYVAKLWIENDKDDIISEKSFKLTKGQYINFSNLLEAL